MKKSLLSIAALATAFTSLVVALAALTVASRSLNVTEGQVLLAAASAGVQPHTEEHGVSVGAAVALLPPRFAERVNEMMGYIQTDEILKTAYETGYAAAKNAL